MVEFLTHLRNLFPGTQAVKDTVTAVSLTINSLAKYWNILQIDDLARQTDRQRDRMSRHPHKQSRPADSLNIVL